MNEKLKNIILCIFVAYIISHWLLIYHCYHVSPSHFWLFFKWIRDNFGYKEIFFHIFVALLVGIITYKCLTGNNNK